MKVRELIEKLTCEDQELDVHVSYNFGDYWRTQVAPAVLNAEVQSVVWSDYHGMPKHAPDDEDGTKVFLIEARGGVR